MGNCDVVIPSKNAPWWLALCLTELFRNAGEDELGKVLVIDDGSTPDAYAQIERICARHPGATLYKNPGRPGFGGACNFGVSKSTAPYLLFLNTDCLIVRGTIRKLVAACEADSSIGLACPLSNNSPCLTLPLLPGRSYHEMNDLLERAAAKLPASEVAFDACTVVGNCLLITRKCWEKTGEFGSTWGQGYGEESDFQMRAIEFGFRGVALTNAYVYHFGNGSFRYEPGANLLRERNHALFLEKWGEKYVELRAKQEQSDPVEVASKRMAALSDEPLKPDVLFILPGLTQGVGGVHAVVDLCNHLQREGFDAKVAVLGYFTAERLKDYLEPIFAGLLHFPDETTFLKQNWCAPRCVVATLYSTMTSCAMYAAYHGIQAAYFVQGYECLFCNGSLYNTVADSYGMAHQILVTSNWLKERVSSHGLEKPPAVLPIGIDLDVFVPVKREQAKEVRIGMVLRSSADKGQWILLDLLHELGPLRERVKLTVMAAAEYERPREWSDDNCRWLKLPLDRATIATELAACDIFVDASLHEGFGLFPLEAMACGATAIVSDSGGINQYMRHGVNGLIVPELNRPEKFVAAIRSLVDDPAKLKNLRAEALKTAAEYEVAARYRAYGAFFKQMLAEPVKRRDPNWLAAAKMLRNETDRLDARVKILVDHTAALEQRQNELVAERGRIMSGMSFRIGRLFTAPIRALLGKQ